ncbi:MAG: hypothetical protein WBP81_16295, partial [Solirubrobacteraceae bacterium]
VRARIVCELPPGGDVRVVAQVEASIQQRGLQIRRRTARRPASVKGSNSGSEERIGTMPEEARPV